ncbi:MAG TPA: Hsp20/alpha crystallin family protein, partial [Rhodospirillales bacterium]|nr:Hsp20/alpha crystallin family protein [Rhodospirillales bacterium]
VPFPTAGAGELLPEVDIVETDDAYKVVAELPGVDPDDVSIELRGDMLTIRGEKKAEREEKEENRYLLERRFGRFERTIRLPAEIEPDKAEASFDKGVLTIRLPKPEAAQKPVKRIEVKAA